MEYYHRIRQTFISLICLFTTLFLCPVSVNAQWKLLEGLAKTSRIHVPIYPKHSLSAFYTPFTDAYLRSALERSAIVYPAEVRSSTLLARGEIFLYEPKKLEQRPLFPEDFVKLANDNIQFRKESKQINHVFEALRSVTSENLYGTWRVIRPEEPLNTRVILEKTDSYNTEGKYFDGEYIFISPLMEMTFIRVDQGQPQFYVDCQLQNKGNKVLYPTHPSKFIRAIEIKRDATVRLIANDIHGNNDGNIGNILLPHTTAENSASTNSNQWWINYIEKVIEEQMLKQGIDKMEKQMFKNGMHIDFEIEEDEIGYIIYRCEYKLDAA